MDALLTYLKHNKWFVISFALVLLGGIFLRTYEFHDWLRFSGDQARDATIIRTAVEEGGSLPLLGPLAGGTKFFLGPMYYYFSFVSAKLFGVSPDRLAYPTLFLSILLIPGFFLFLREYFKRKTALMLTALLGASYLFVNASRFSSNQNLVPFFVLLYLWGLLKILNDPRRFQPGWAIMLGIGMGVGVQMHTLILAVMPIVALLAFLFLLKRKASGAWKSFAVVLILTFVLNTGQIVSEFQTDFQNTAAFLDGAGRETDNSLIENLLSITACHAEANVHAVASLYDDNDCEEVLDFSQERWEQAGALPLGIASLVFSLLGYSLLITAFRHETSPERKNFLGLVIVYSVVGLVILVSVATFVHTVYFLFLFFVPFVLLGILWETLEKRIDPMWGERVIVGTFLLLLACSLGRDLTKAANYSRGLEDNDDNSTLGQIEAMSEYVLANIPAGTDHVYFSGGKDLSKRFFKPIKYFANRQGIEMTSVTTVSRSGLVSGTPLFFISDDPNKLDKNTGDILSGHEVLSKEKFFNQAIFNLEN